MRTFRKAPGAKDDRDAAGPVLGLLGHKLCCRRLQRAVAFELYHPGRSDLRKGWNALDLLEQCRRKPESFQFKRVLNPYDACAVGRFVHQTGLDNLAIGCEGDRLFGGGEVSGGKAVGVGGMPVDFGAQALRDEVGEADAGGIAVAVIRQVEDGRGRENRARAGRRCAATCR